jgi:hypothetical protein
LKVVISNDSSSFSSSLVRKTYNRYSHERDFPIHSISPFFVQTDSKRKREKIEQKWLEGCGKRTNH